MEEEGPQLSGIWANVVKYGLAVATVVFYGTTLLHFSYTPDDTYIYLQYAKNIALGNGFSFNAGVPSFGVTSPLWTLLISVGALCKLDPFIVAKTFDLVFASLSIIQVFILAFIILRDRAFAIMAAFMFSLDAWLLRWSGTGMETSLAVLLTVLVVSYAYRNEYLVASFVCGVLTLVRPEAVLLFLVIQADNFLNTTVYKPVLKTFVSSLGIYFGVLTPWLIFSYVQFGTIIPNTLLAKSGVFSLSGVLETLIESVRVLSVTQLIPLMLLIVGVVEARRNPQWKVRRVELFPLLWVVALFLGYAVQNVQVVSRYLLPVIPFIIIYGLWGLKRITESWRLPPQRGVQFLLFITIITVFQNQVVYHRQMVPHMKSFAAGMNHLRPMAYWLRTNAQSEASVLASDAGLLGYVSEKNLFDAAGLITPGVRKSFEGIGYDEGMMQARYAAAVQPDFIVDRASIQARLKSNTVQPIMSVDFPGLGLSKPDTVYYTLYRVLK